MRNKRKAKTCEYLLIGGFAAGEAGHIAPTITLNHGNGYGENIQRVVERFPAGTKYRIVTERAKELSKQMNVKLGRDFPEDEWLGPKLEDVC